MTQLEREGMSTLSEIRKIERELNVIENAEPQIKESADWYKSFGQLIHKHRAMTLGSPTPLREGKEYKELSAETTYAQSRRDKIPLRREELEKAKERLIPKEKLLYHEYERKKEEFRKLQAYANSCLSGHLGYRICDCSCLKPEALR